jgi:HK97 family phage portal protein
VISESLAMLPAHVYSGTETSSQKLPNHSLWPVVHDKPNAEMGPMTFRDTLQMHACVWGNGYAQIIRSRATDAVGEMNPWLPEQVRRDRDRSGRGVYIWKDGNSAEQTFNVRDVFHVRGPSYDGITGYSVACLAAESIGLSMAAEQFAAQFYGTGGRVPGYLTNPGRFRTQAEFDEFRAKWEEVYGGTSGWHKTTILESGMDWKPLGVKPEEMQFIETRGWMVSELCRWMRVQPHLVADLSRATNNNIEHQSIEFVNYTLAPWKGRWEEQYNIKCIPQSEFGKVFVRIDTSQLMRGDFAARMAGYASALQNGIASINEVRALEFLNPIPGGDALHIQLNQQTVPGTGEPTASELATIAKISQGGVQSNA